MFTDLTILKNAELALVKLGDKPAAQAAAFVARMQPAEQLAAHSCQLEGDKMRLISLLDHVATREHLEADLQGYLAQPAKPEADPDDGTQTV